MLGSVDVGGTVVVADFEAGLGTLSRMRGVPVDVAVVVTEVTVKSLEVTRRAVRLITDEQLAARVVVVANRLSSVEDVGLVRAELGHVDLLEVPDDPQVRAADREGTAPLDTAPGAPAVQALAGLAQRLVTPQR